MSGNTLRPIGHQYALAMLGGGEERVRSLAQSAGTQLTMDAFLRVQDEEPVPAFLHSALCAMSLPTKRPKDDTLPILREDGKYALAINPGRSFRQSTASRSCEASACPMAPTLASP